MNWLFLWVTMAPFSFTPLLWTKRTINRRRFFEKNYWSTNMFSKRKFVPSLLHQMHSWRVSVGERAERFDRISARDGEKCWEDVRRENERIVARIRSVRSSLSSRTSFDPTTSRSTRTDRSSADQRPRKSIESIDRTERDSCRTIQRREETVFGETTGKDDEGFSRSRWRSRSVRSRCSIDSSLLSKATRSDPTEIRSSLLSFQRVDRSRLGRLPSGIGWTNRNIWTTTTNSSRSDRTAGKWRRSSSLSSSSLDARSKAIFLLGLTFRSSRSKTNQLSSTRKWRSAPTNEAMLSNASIRSNEISI